MRLDDAIPLVLLDDARAGGAPARLYRSPVRTIRADRIDEVIPALNALRSGQAEGLEAAGFLAYEAGAAFESRLAQRADPAGPLLWFGLFDGYSIIAAAEVANMLPAAEGAWIGQPEPVIARDRYDAMMAEILDLIRAGDIYQANLTFRARVPLIGDLLAAYAQLRARSGAGYGAIVMTGQETLLSLSPELFFALDGRTLTTRPMKGTARRGATMEADRALVAALSADTKQRAENLMIVDLLRNDLSRVARPGSVAVPDLFAIESYPTVHQMVSTITAQIDDGHDAVDVIAALFPCGSITGAPKIRAMEVIGDIEGNNPRGVYTGAIGRIDATGDAMFSVAIRTLTLTPGDDHAVLGLGSGIVADSQSAMEWDECLTKAAFLRGAAGPDLIETMAFDPQQGITLLERHLARMKDSAARFGYRFDRHEARNELQAATFALRANSTVRLLLAPGGAIAIETRGAPPVAVQPVDVAVLPLPVDPRDFRLRHKTSDRAFYDTARYATGMFEVVFTDPQGRLTEGSFTSIFVERANVLVTPPLGLGLLPGVLRAELIESGRAVEGILTVDDLAGGFWIGNALRGLIAARLRS